MKGNVILVGAGPGDPGLLTQKGRQALEQAQVVVFDRLVSPAILALIPPQAEAIDVGKESLTVAIFGDKSKTSALIGLLEDFGILEIAKTGTLAIERGRGTIYDDDKLKEEYNYGKNVL